MKRKFDKKRQNSQDIKVEDSRLYSFPFSFLFIFSFLDLGLEVSMTSHVTITTVIYYNKRYYILSYMHYSYKLQSYNHMIYKSI